MDKPEINITVMPGAQMNGLVHEQYNYFGTVQQVTKSEARAAFFAEAEEAEMAEEDPVQAETLAQKIAALFTAGILSESDPSRLYFLLLAMWARRLLASKEIPAFVRMVKEAYPALISEERKEQMVIYAVQNMNKKSSKYFDTFITDQHSMIDFVVSMYPSKKDGSPRKDCKEAVELTNKLFLALK